MNQVRTYPDINIKAWMNGIPVLKNRKGNPGKKKPRRYLAWTTAFDIETTALTDIEQSFMYVWQWQLSESYTIIGRTWDEFKDVIRQIKEAMPPETWMVVYVHNLSYEFSFLQGIYDFQPEEVFAVKPRKILKCDMYGVFEFRCSYLHSNMSLKQYLKKFQVEHQKLSGEEYDYSKIRYPWTPLSEMELAYAVNDVLGLVEAINKEMWLDGDTLSTVPLTSTGYVRRNAKRAMKNKVDHRLVPSIYPTEEQYDVLREAFRGGNTHANRFYANEIIRNVHSADRSSSYPAVMCNCEYPMTEFIPICNEDLNLDYIVNCITARHKAVLMRVCIRKLRLKSDFWGCPYIPVDKCRNLRNASHTIDNGRLLSADYLEISITDVDLRIIMNEYDGEIGILKAWYATYKKLPQPLIDEVISYYRKKTELKGVKGQEIMYDKSKALLNSLYGMMAQDIVKFNIVYDRTAGKEDPLQLWHDDLTKTKAQILAERKGKAFLAYQWGVWVTSWARYHFELGVRECHNHNTGGDAFFIYGDTDSCKYTGTVDWTEYNNARIKECLESGSYATDPAGHTHYMGVYESEDNPETGVAYYAFKTLGAKKYAYIEKPDGDVHVTIAGVSKKKGGAELTKRGGLQSFAPDFVFTEAGGTEAVYNDNADFWIEREGHQLHITSNVCLLPSEYTVGITGEYSRIIKYAHSYLDNPYVI